MRAPIPRVGRLTTRSNDEWLARLEAEDVPCAPVVTRESLLEHPQVIENEIVVEGQHAGGRRLILHGQIPVELAVVCLRDGGRPDRRSGRCDLESDERDDDRFVDRNVGGLSGDGLDGSDGDGGGADGGVRGGDCGVDCG